MSCIRIGSRTNDIMIKKKDGGRKKKNNTKESAAGKMFGENTTNEINL